MSDETANDLLDAIDRLTKPNRTKMVQDPKVAGQHPETVTVELPPLLAQLEAAIAGSMNRSAGSGALANERNVLDSDALHRFLTIKATIGDWARSVKADVDMGDPAAALRRWYMAYVASPRELESVRFYTRKTQQWIATIDQKLDPPRVRELPDPCPECKSKDWWNPSDKHRYLHPLIVEYRPTGPDMIQEATARCRACAKTWGVRQLAYEIEQAESDTPEIQEVLALPTNS